MIELLSRPWPWYVAGPLIGLMVPVLLVVGNKLFGISSSFRHACAACLPARSEFFSYDWRAAGAWNLVFATGVLIGGVIAGTLLANPDAIAISAATRADLAALGVADFEGIVPATLFSWEALLSPSGFLMLVVGGFLVGFGAAYAGGCTSGHGVAGLADLQISSLVAVVGFFVGGLISTFLLLPLIL